MLILYICNFSDYSSHRRSNVLARSKRFTQICLSVSHTVNHEYQLVVQQLQSLQQVNEAICRVLTSQISGSAHTHTCTHMHTHTHTTPSVSIHCSVMHVRTYVRIRDIFFIICVMGRIMSLKELVSAANQGTELSE